MRPEPLPERSEEESSPPPRWAVNVKAERRRVQRLTVVQLGPRPRQKRFVMPDEAVMLRPLVRLGLFSRKDNPGMVDNLRLSLPNGEVYLHGARLSWQDLRTLMVITEKARLAKGELPVLSLSATQLAGAVSSGKANPSDKEVKRARQSLERLTLSRLSFEMKGIGQVGRPDRLAPLLTVEASLGDDQYRPAEWLQAMFADAFDPRRRDSQHRLRGLVEKRACWPVFQNLRRGALLLYAFLEAEDWSSKKPGRSPTHSGVTTRQAELFMGQPMLNLLDLCDVEETRRQEEFLNRWMHRIGVRDSRYTSYGVFRTADKKRLPILDVWRLPASTPARPYMGPLCRRCGLPDPTKSCCCDTDLGSRCGGDSCPRCIQEDNQ